MEKKPDYLECNHEWFLPYDKDGFEYFVHAEQEKELQQASLKFKNEVEEVLKEYFKKPAFYGSWEKEDDT